MTNQVGRNDPCPCGSGRKYKHCCAELEEVAGDELLLRATLSSMLRGLDPAEAEDLREALSDQALDQLLQFVSQGLSELETLDGPTAAALIEPLVVPLQWAERYGDLRQLMLEVVNRFGIADSFAPWQAEWMAELAALENTDARHWLDLLSSHVTDNPSGFWSLVGRFRFHDDDRAIALLSTARRVLAEAPEPPTELKDEVYRVGVTALINHLLSEGHNLSPGDELFDKLIAGDQFAGDWWSGVVQRMTGRVKDVLTPSDFEDAPDVGPENLERYTHLTIEFGRYLVELGWGRQRAELARHGIFSYLLASADLRKPSRTARKIRRKGQEDRRAGKASGIRVRRVAWRPAFLLVDVELFGEYATDVLDQRSPPVHDLAATALAVGDWHRFLAHKELAAQPDADAASDKFQELLPRFGRNAARLKCDPEMVNEVTG